MLLTSLSLLVSLHEFGLVKLSARLALSLSSILLSNVNLAGIPVLEYLTEIFEVKMPNS